MKQGVLAEAARQRFTASIAVPQQFFTEEATRISHACLAMARRFHRGGRLLAFGAGNAVTDAQHISVEFVHPVIVGKRALPALALGTDIASTFGLADGGRSWHGLYAAQVETIGRLEDIAIGIDSRADDEAVRAGLQAAAERGLLTIALTGRDDGRLSEVPLDFLFAVPTTDQGLVQETHETLYHVLWELVHVFFEHPSLLEAPKSPATGQPR